MIAAVEAFTRLNRRAPDALWCAPGRVNLIGEHTDYNDGLVLPFAIDRSAVVAAGLRGDGMVRCTSLQMRDQVAMRLADVVPGRVGGWAAYPLGVLWAMRQAGVIVPGVDIVIDSGVPVGAGLASSAAVEVAVALVVADAVGVELSNDDLARCCQAGEQSVAGAPTGLMDPLAVLGCRAGHALLLDCRSLARELVPLGVEDATATMLVIDTTVAHATGGTGYRSRRRECEQAARELGVRSLRDATAADVGSRLSGVLQRRARHVVSENERVARAAEVLRSADPRQVGPLLASSHASLRDDFEVSCAELDLAVDTAMGAGAWGARMTGAGFGGCAIALVPCEKRNQVADAVRAGFSRQRFAAPNVFDVTAADGAQRCG